MVTTIKAQSEGTTATPMGPFSPAYFRIWMDILVDNTRFVTSRLREDIETQKAILACRSPEEVMRVQSKFFHDAVGQYTQHGKQIGEKLAAVTRAA